MGSSRNAGKLTGGGKVQQRPRLISSAITQDQIQGHPNTYSIYELLEHMKGQVLQNHSYRISMTALTAGHPRTRGQEIDQ